MNTYLNDMKRERKIIVEAVSKQLLSKKCNIKVTIEYNKWFLIEFLENLPIKEIRVRQRVIEINTINFAASSKIAIDSFQEKDEDIYESLYFIPELNSRIISLINTKIEDSDYDYALELVDSFMKDGSYLSFIKKGVSKETLIKNMTDFLNSADVIKIDSDLKINFKISNNILIAKSFEQSDIEFDLNTIISIVHVSNGCWEISYEKYCKKFTSKIETFLLKTHDQIE